MLSPTQIHELISAVKDQGYVRIPGLLNEETTRRIEAECEVLQDTYYSTECLDRHIAYPSDSTPTRVSHAMMVSQETGPLPSIQLADGSTLAELVALHNQCLAALTGREVPASSRSMLNWQRYFGQSKPVAEHFDGEYFAYDKLSETEFTLLEGLLPRYVLIFTLWNRNTGSIQGTVLKDIRSGEKVAPPSMSGDLLIFDNIRYRHSVPTLLEPRSMVGLRNFDFNPLHFSRKPEFFLPERSYEPIPEGHVSDQVDSIAAQLEFLARRWPSIRKQQVEVGAVF